MPTLEDQTPKTKPDSHHDDVELTPAERAASDQLLAEAGDKHSLYSGKNERGATGKVATAVIAATPIGKLAGFFRRNKTASITGGGILSFIVGIVVFISMLSSGPGLLIAKHSIIADFNFGPHDRSIAGRAHRIRNHIATRQYDNSQLGQKIQTAGADGNRRAIIADTDGRRVSQYGRRTTYRNVISSRVSNVSWRFFTGQSRNSPDYVNKRNRMLGINEDRQRAPTRVDEIQQDGQGQETRTENNSRSNNINEITQEIKNSPNESRTIARQAARRVSSSGVVATVMIGCLSAAYDDLIPDDKEQYELLITMATALLTAGSQLAYGENVHGDEVADVLSAYNDTVEAEGGYDEDGNYIEGDGSVHRSFSQSAAWKRATNQPVSGSEEDADLRYDNLVNIGLLSNSFRHIGRTVNSIPGTGMTCSFIGHPIVGITATGIEAVAAALSGGTAAAIKVALREGAFIAALAFLFEQISFDSIIPDGPVMLMAAQDMGTNLSQSEYARSQGAPPVSNATANQLRTDHFAALAQEDREKGLVWRYLDRSNPRSLMTTLAMQAPDSFSATLRSLSTVPRQIPSMVASITSPRVSANPDFHNYNIRQYAFTEADLELDPLENATYVESALRCAGGADIQPGDNCTDSKTREGEHMLRIYNNCINTTRAYWQIEDDRLCTRPSSSERRAWVKVGVWHLDNGIVDDLECLSHSEPCGFTATRQLSEEIGS